MSTKTIMAVGYATFEDYQQRNGCVTDQECDTLAEARKRAKRYLTEEYRQSSEASSILEYSQVTVNGECVNDYFAPKLTPGAELAEMNEMDAKHPGWDESARTST